MVILGNQIFETEAQQVNNRNENRRTYRNTISDYSQRKDTLKKILN